jgi:hypothetical protein
MINDLTGLSSIKDGYARSIEFFIFEVPKVLMLLTLIVFVMGIIRTFFSPEKTRALLEKKSLFLPAERKSYPMEFYTFLGMENPFQLCPGFQR